MEEHFDAFAFYLYLVNQSFVFVRIRTDRFVVIVEKIKNVNLLVT